MIRLANHAAHPFHGWIRVTTDRPPADPAGIATTDAGDEIRYVVGLPTGSDTRAVDLLVALEPGQRLEVDLSRAEAAPFDLGPPPADLGDLTVNGVPMQLVEAKPDGAAWTAHCRARIGRMLCVDVWLRHYPGEAWAHGECMVTCSNPAVPDLGEECPLPRIKLGDGITIEAGRVYNEPLPYPTRFADGQARAWPFHVMWLAQATPEQAESMLALPSVAANGIASLYPQGNPILPPDFDAAAFMREKVPEAVRRLHTWERGILGPNTRSADTGEQEDQLLHAEALAPNGVGCELAVYLSALKMANRPCHHLEVDGSQVDIDRHRAKRTLMFEGRPDRRISEDMLGKSADVGQQLTPDAANGWFGPDPEHWLLSRLYEACRLVYSPACQHLLAAQARLYPFQWTTTPGWSTSQTYASRAVGYECLNAARMFVGLADRDLAERTRKHWLARWERVLRPALMLREHWYDGFADLHPPRWAPWQQAIGAYGLDIAGEVFGLAEARECALSAARVVMRDGFRMDGQGKWRTWKSTTLPFDVARNDPDNTYWLFGSPLAVAVVLRHDAADEQANEVWRAMLGDASGPKHWTWMPEVAR